ncbi:MAG: 5-oxoprolinase subunit B family protein [Nocardioidaceae bacterium]
MSDPVRVLRYGDRALLAELDGTAAAVSYAEVLRSAGLEHVDDLVPGARTVLVVAGPRADLDTLTVRMRELRPEPETEPSDDADTIEIGVRYDGPDLEAVAELTGLSADEVVRAHTGTPWRVAFGGFSPGFAYLSGGDERLAVPRRDEARTKVPVGSVGLAGEFSGVYPSASPGGWQLIGSTEQVMWDLERDPPALLRPGAWVRFVDEGRS